MKKDALFMYAIVIIITLGFISYLYYVFSDYSEDKNSQTKKKFKTLDSIYVSGTCSEYHTDISAEYSGKISKVELLDSNSIAYKGILDKSSKEKFSLNSEAKGNRAFIEDFFRYKAPDFVDIDMNDELDFNSNKLSLYGLGWRNVVDSDGGLDGLRSQHLTECLVSKIADKN